MVEVSKTPSYNCLASHLPDEFAIRFDIVAVVIRANDQDFFPQLKSKEPFNLVGRGALAQAKIIQAASCWVEACHAQECNHYLLIFFLQAFHEQEKKCENADLSPRFKKAKKE
jgi:hypothetical protein